MLRYELVIRLLKPNCGITHLKYPINSTTAVQVAACMSNYIAKYQYMQIANVILSVRYQKKGHKPWGEMGWSVGYHSDVISLAYI